MTDGIVIIGGGHGGAQLCVSLRQHEYSGKIILVSSENLLPYHRPPLSKAFLKDGAVKTQPIRPKEFYHNNAIQLKLGQTVREIARKDKSIILGDGSRLKYSKLVLATGAKARSLSIPGADGKSVFNLKTASDAKILRNKVFQASSVGVIGGGFIGLEAASTFLSLGKSVTVFEAGERLMGRAVSPEVSNWFLNKHQANGMKIVLNANVSEIVLKKLQVTGVNCNSQLHPLDLVLVGIGVEANCELAKLAGIDCNNGITVNSNMQTSDPDILAIGDCVSFRHWQTDTWVRLESVQNANDQARNAALTITGNPVPFLAVPWFWSDHGSDKLQIVGLSNGANMQIMRESADGNKMSVFHFCEQKLVAIDTINNPTDHMIGRKLLPKGLSPKISDLGSPEFDLRSLL